MLLAQCAAVDGEAGGFIAVPPMAGAAAVEGLAGAVAAGAGGDGLAPGAAAVEGFAGALPLGGELGLLQPLMAKPKQATAIPTSIVRFMRFLLT
ncbi:hypothetical protein GCM10007898_29000 [Dyella flagellata]|uniref:Uncharacterized protein n=1 Tax=Dyella flagellata TaxID=1867833 RepID=A0ABQ5XEB7_9GAMM|nr:hypothetical protein GCM10007898_29000 [Dyella flagellata]